MNIINRILILFLCSIYCCYCQTINLNQGEIIDFLRINQLDKKFNTNFSFNIRPIHIGKNAIDVEKFDFFKNSIPVFNKSLNKKSSLKILPVDLNFEYNSHHPYNRNNGSMLPNKGFQNLLSFGIFFELGPLSIQFKPEHVYAENKDFPGFPDSHFPVIWSQRFNLWNHSDIPERFGNKRHNMKLIGQSSIRLNFNSLSFGFSNENLWWGPSIRNSIMLSNHSRGFKHLTFNTKKPIKTKVGNFEWQLVSGFLEPSGYNPPIDKVYAGTYLYVPKINQLGELDDVRYFQGLIFNYSPKFIPGLSVGFIRWVQMYSALVEGKYTWMKGNPNYFPIFSNLFRKNDSFSDYEEQTDQAAGVFFRWVWKESKAEIYGEFHYNDAKQNFRDLLLDSDHARAATIGIQKIFQNNSNKYLFSWEWTTMEQSASRLLRNAGSWYMHAYIYHGYTNFGEVMGSSIGPGSNSHYISISKINGFKKIGFSFEIVDNDNDFYYTAFQSSNDFRRYWKDYNLHIFYRNRIKKLLLSSNLVYSRSLNYQWELDPTVEPYFHRGTDVNNFHINLKITYPIFD